MKTHRSFARGWELYAASALLAAAVAGSFAAGPSRVGAQTQAELKAAAKPSATPAAAPKQIKIDLSAAVKVPLPSEMKELEPAAFKTSDGKTGWVVRVPGGRPPATPGYSDGTVLVGGGYGSPDVYVSAS